MRPIVRSSEGAYLFGDVHTASEPLPMHQHLALGSVAPCAAKSHSATSAALQYKRRDQRCTTQVAVNRAEGWPRDCKRIPSHVLCRRGRVLGA
jgi:hypothetical protein